MCLKTKLDKLRLQNISYFWVAMNEANHIDVRTRLLGISFNICMITARTEILDLLDMGG